MSALAALGAPERAFKLASVLLAYPTAAVFEGLDTLRDCARETSPKPARAEFGAFLDWLDATDSGRVVEHYVETFDLRRRCALYLTWFRHGDTRKRGMAMVEFKGAYRGVGFDPREDELPDYLPMVLEFAAYSPRGGRLLRSHRADLELLHRALGQAETPYAHLLAAVIAQLPRLSRREALVVHRSWESGPPSEEVGLEPFAPPDYLRGYGALRQAQGPVAAQGPGGQR